MKNNSTYIPPAIKFYSSFDEALSADPEWDQYLFDKKEKWEFKDLFNLPRTFVVAEPGYGKTRLLREIVSRASNNGKKAIGLDSKKIIETNVKEFILNQLKDASTVKSDGFELKNEENIIICFDALDEVKLENFSLTVEKIKAFLAEYKKITAIISCRWHFFRKHKALFANLDFRYARIFPFSTEQVKLYLQRNKISHENIEEIFDKLSFRGRDLVIQTPRYLELLLSLIKDRGIENISAITKTNLFEFFIYKKLEIEDKNLTTQKRDLIKRVLEKLALIMEIYQTNLLKKDELMSFFDDLQSDLKSSLLQQVSLEVFYDKTVLKDNIDTIEFDNTEFQEYLAAKETIRLGQNIRTIFELSVDPEIREIYPSWFNTLGFVVDLDVSLLKPLLDFGQMSKEGITQDEGYHRFLTKINIERLHVEKRKEIFAQVFSYYQSVLHWIGWDIALNLSHYFDQSHCDLLKYYVDGRRFRDNETKRIVHLGNVAQVVGLLLERDILNNEERDYWKRKLIKFANDKNENGVLQRQALFALGNLGDDKVIRKIENVWRSDNKLVRDAFLKLCIDVNPNHDLSIKYFVEGTKQESIYARYGLHEVIDIKAVKKLLDVFIHDISFLEQFIRRESIFKDKDKKLIEHIEAVWDSDIEDKLQLIVQKAFRSRHWYQARDSKFISNVALLLKQKNENYLFDLISQIAKSDNLKKNLYGFKNLFSILLEKVQVKEFVNQLLRFEKGKLDALWTLQQIKSSNRPDAEEIYEEGRKYLSTEYKQTESRWEKQDQEPSEEQRRYEEFQLKLEPEEGKYSQDVFEFYLNNKDTLSPLVTKKENDRLKSLIEGSVFDQFDPGQQKLTFTHKNGSSTSYTTHAYIYIFGDCIQMASELDLDIAKYRKRIINYVPFAYSEHLEAIFSLVKNVQPDEIKSLLAVYKRKNSDLPRFMPRSFIQASEKYVIKEAVPILREFVAQNDFSIYDRISALKTSDFLNPDAAFLGKMFEQYTEDQEKLAVAANELLIVNHKDEGAINWRFEELINRAFPFRESVGVHSVSPQEHELHDKEFAAPLMKLKHPHYEKQFLDVLGESFNIYEKEDHRPYAQHLWQIVCAYFDNLKEERSYKPLRNLEKFVEEHSSDEGINWFKYRLKELKRSYIIFIGKPTSVNECIQKYNTLKTQQYLEIATPFDLNEKVKDVIDTDLRRWVESEGAYSFIVVDKVFDAKKQNYEDFIQKTIKTQIEKAFLKRGLEVNITREPQLLDDKRVDFLVSYGFIGPILIEVKLSKSKDLAGSQKKLENKQSYKSLIKYMEGYNAPFGIFLVFDNKKRTTISEEWGNHFEKIRSAYQKIDNVTVLGLECISGK
ncbi:MAG: hypothetical protein P9L89_04815 [Candidatus Celaenobacter polaris]|nr:hypothetical protein [Candidatus Celaenobacter polaris]